MLVLTVVLSDARLGQARTAFVQKPRFKWVCELYCADVLVKHITRNFVNNSYKSHMWYDWKQFLAGDVILCFHGAPATICFRSRKKLEALGACGLAALRKIVVEFSQCANAML